MLLPAPVDVRRAVGARAMAGSRVNPGSSTQHAIDDESRQRGLYPDAADAVVLVPVVRDADDTQRVPDEDAALIYGIGTSSLQPDSVSRLSGFVTRRGWRLARAHADVDGSAHPSELFWLVTALAGPHSGATTVLVLDERTYASMQDHLWLRVAVQHAGGVLCVGGDVPAIGGADAAPGPRVVTAFVQVVYPLGMCRGDVG